MIQYIVYPLYYIAFPLIMIFLLTKLWGIREFSQGLMDFLSRRKKKNINNISIQLKNIKKYQVLFVVFLLISLPFMTFATTTLSDHYMEEATFYVTSPMGAYVTSDNPVQGSIEGGLGPQEVIEKMKEKPDYWHTEDIMDEVDLEKLTRIPGRLAVYRMKKFGRNDIVMTYTYYSPIPITRSFGFQISPEGEEAYLLEENTLIYPMNPGNTDPFDL